MQIAVTKLHEKSDDINETFLKYGHEAVIVPTMGAQPPEDTSSLERLCDLVEKCEIDFLIFTSSLGVEKFLSRCRVPDKTSIISVGPKTAAKVKDFGYESEVLASFSSEHFAEHLSHRIKGKTVGIARANVPNPELVKSLEESGAGVIEAVAYELKPVSNDIKKVIGKVDAVIFTSGKSFENASLTQEDLKNVTVVAIGPKTAKSMEKCGVIPDLIGAGTLEDCLERLGNK